MAQQEYSPCSDCGTLPCKRPKRVLDDCCSCSGEVCGDPACPAIELITCEACNRGDNEMQLILCDGCDHACHLACMDPPVSFVPETWFCRRCLSASLNLNETDGRRVAGQACCKYFSDFYRQEISWQSGSFPQPSEIFRSAIMNMDNLDHEASSRVLSCKCKRSRCMKKYCECYQNSSACTSRCTCNDCGNTISERMRKPGTFQVRASSTSPVNVFDQDAESVHLVPKIVKPNSYSRWRLESHLKERDRSPLPHELPREVQLLAAEAYTRQQTLQHQNQGSRASNRMLS
uniref:PHD-type domain-containing protein n=1 Tax=Hanusia phi TaxID=3032 RepID=A0A7S0EYQ6_9CRYP|mmetsp:Transcript_34488/g.77773  ORF Transcript_34488/g.77773 Transcript_34488/m.77773 type:complete len:289 (+) Transcript_34488:181-1047(+)